MRNSSITSVIVATTLDSKRAVLIHNAVRSILEQAESPCVPIIVVNGREYDREAFIYWEARRDVRFVYSEQGDYLKARLTGRTRVDTEFFGFLDDDDMYLLNSLQYRTGPLQADHRLDLVVGNGLIVRGGIEIPALSRLDLHRKDCLHSLLVENWMPSAGAATFRTDSVGVDYFQHNDRHLEWTALALRLSVDSKSIHFLDEMTYKIADTPGSLSKMPAYRAGLHTTLAQLLKLNMPAKAKRYWNERYRDSLHALSEYYRSSGEMKSAWRYHLESLFRPGGLRFIPYTRHLLVSKQERG